MWVKLDCSYTCCSTLCLRDEANLNKLVFIVRLYFRISYLLLQVIDLQVFALPRITLKPLVPSFPCFAKILVSLMEKVSSEACINFGYFPMYQATYMLFTFLQPHVDFGLKLLGADLMAIPGLYGFVQVRSALTV